MGLRRGAVAVDYEDYSAYTLEELEREVHRLAEMRLVALEFEMLDDALGDGPEIESQACAPYCGCHTCVVREVVDAAWPALKELVFREES